MSDKLKQCLDGYQRFLQKYHHQDESVMTSLAENGQKPQIMVVACCDSRVDPALLFQCDPGDLFVVRNVANIVPPFESDEFHHGTSAALELGVCYFKVKHLILLGHSQCGGLTALLTKQVLPNNDFVDKWVSLADDSAAKDMAVDDFAKQSLNQSYQNCLTFPWLKQAMDDNRLSVDRWFFDIKTAQIFAHDEQTQNYTPVMA